MFQVWMPSHSDKRVGRQSFSFYLIHREASKKNFFDASYVKPMKKCETNQIRVPKKGCVDIPDYYQKDDAFFHGSKARRMAFTARAEERMLHAFSSNMNTGDYTQMTIDLQRVLEKEVFKKEDGDVFCFSGYHHSVMLLSALAQRLRRGPREHLFISLQGKDGLSRVVGHEGTTVNDLVSDALFRIDVVQRDFRESRSWKLYQRLKRLFPIIFKYAPSWDEVLRQAIDEGLRDVIPRGFVYEGCRLGRASKNVSFEAFSHFYADDMSLRATKDDDDDDLLVRVQTKSDGRDWKRDYFVMLNVGLKLRRRSDDAVLYYHVPIRLLSFAVRSFETRWIQPRSVRLPRQSASLYSGSMYTLLVYFLYSFNSTQLLLAGACGVLYLLETLSLRELDEYLSSERPIGHVFKQVASNDKLSRIQLDMIFNKLEGFTASESRRFKAGVRLTTDALIVNEVLSHAPVYRVNFISPETIEGG